MDQAEPYLAIDADPSVRALYFSQQLNNAREEFDNLKRDKLQMEGQLKQEKHDMEGQLKREKHDMEVEYHNSISKVRRERDAAEHRVQELESEKDEVERRKRDIQEREVHINELRAKLEAMLKKKVCSHVLLIWFSV